ncbi:translation initiation factor IF-2 [Bos taurus]|uniref:translation initiation factor IF-2 n=1 Tax=Bos taurus TaxID=9913 RepID=UPI0028CB7DC2|nr:translation initiation factor IF-2 [Bos taurus]
MAGGAARERGAQSSPSLRGARVRIQHKEKSGRRRGAEGRQGSCPPGSSEASGLDGPTGGQRRGERRPPGEPQGRAPEGPSGGRLAPGCDLPAARAPEPRGQRKFEEQLPSWGRGGELETRVPLKFAGRQERAGGSFPPSRLEREEEAGEVPPTPGKREGRREKGKGEEKRAGPGNHLRLPRPPRPAPAGRWWPHAWAHPGRPGTVAGSRVSEVAATLPARASRRLDRALDRPRPSAGRGGRRGGGGGKPSCGCSPALLPARPRSARPRPRGDISGPLWVPRISPVPPLESGQGFRAAVVDIVRSSSG